MPLIILFVKDVSILHQIDNSYPDAFFFVLTELDFLSWDPPLFPPPPVLFVSFITGAVLCLVISTFFSDLPLTSFCDLLSGSYNMISGVSTIPTARSNCKTDNNSFVMSLNSQKGLKTFHDLDSHFILSYDKAINIYFVDNKNKRCLLWQNFQFLFHLHAKSLITLKDEKIFFSIFI